MPALAAATVATLSAHVGVFSTVTHRPPSARKGASARVRSVPSRRAMARPLRAHPDAGWSTSVPAPVFMSVPAPAAPAGRNAVSPASTETMVCAASATSIVGRDGDQTPHFRMRYASSSTRSASVRRCVKRRTSPTASPPLRWGGWVLVRHSRKSASMHSAFARRLKPATSQAPARGTVVCPEQIVPLQEKRVSGTPDPLE